MAGERGPPRRTDTPPGLPLIVSPRRGPVRREEVTGEHREYLPERRRDGPRDYAGPERRTPMRPPPPQREPGRASLADTRPATLADLEAFAQRVRVENQEELEPLLERLRYIGGETYESAQERQRRRVRDEERDEDRRRRRREDDEDLERQLDGRNRRTVALITAMGILMTAAGTCAGAVYGSHQQPNMGHADVPTK